MRVNNLVHIFKHLLCIYHTLFSAQFRHANEVKILVKKSNPLRGQSRKKVGNFALQNSRKIDRKQFNLSYKTTSSSAAKSLFIVLKLEPIMHQML